MIIQSSDIDNPAVLAALNENPELYKQALVAAENELRYQGDWRARIPELFHNFKHSLSNTLGIDLGSGSGTILQAVEKLKAEAVAAETLRSELRHRMVVLNDADILEVIDRLIDDSKTLALVRGDNSGPIDDLDYEFEGYLPLSQAAIDRIKANDNQNGSEA